MFAGETLTEFTKRFVNNSSLIEIRERSPETEISDTSRYARDSILQA